MVTGEGSKWLEEGKPQIHFQVGQIGAFKKLQAGQLYLSPSKIMEQILVKATSMLTKDKKMIRNI